MVTTGEASTGESAEGTTGPEAPKCDIGTIPDAPKGECANGSRGGGGANDFFSYIWIANSVGGTVSKINTVTLEEVGRYRTHPDFGDPSRTSVSLNGNVAVANRNGGLVKSYANQTECEDRNGNGVIETSSGANDVLPWDEEECRAWFTPFEYESQRPVAWTPGNWDPTECRYENEKVWTSGASDNGGFGKPGGGGGEGFEGVHVILVDGDNGDVENVVKVTEVIPNYYGIYGMTVDSKGYVWTCAGEVGRFDPDTETWQNATVNGSGGCMEDGNGTLWLASSPLVGVDIDTLEVVHNYNLPDCVHGVSIDFQGFVWGVSMNNSAYRVDASPGEYETFTGLDYPCTYSDMAGFALANAGGWTPAG